MAFHDDFNRSAFSHFLVVGYFLRAHPLGVVSMLWSILPLTAGGFDVCYISAALGGPLSGRTIRERYKRGQTPQALSN